jgi:CRP/FNR family cyclic AMP-dependent transcriptional regulator
MNLVELFRHQVDLQAIPAGQALFREGERGDFMYVLMSGTAEIIIRDRVMETAVAGAIVGEMAIIDESTRSATVVAKSDCMFLPIERERFNFLVQKKPEFALHVMRVLADRLRKTDVVLESIGAGSIDTPASHQQHPAVVDQ